MYEIIDGAIISAQVIGSEHGHMLYFLYIIFSHFLQLLFCSYLS